MADDERFGSWCIVEIYGHRKLAGYVNEASIGGASFVHVFMRVDVHQDGTVTTQLYNPSAIYSITPATEEVVRRLRETVPPPQSALRPARSPFFDEEINLEDADYYDKDDEPDDDDYYDKDDEPDDDDNKRYRE